VLGLLLLVSLPTGELGVAPSNEVRLLSSAPLVLFTVMLTNTWIGALNAAREIVKELPIIRRERAVGLSLSAYVLSKAIVLGTLTALQAALLTAIVLSRQKVGGPGVFLGLSFAELLLVAMLAGVAAMALGLLLSATVSSSDQAMTILPVLLILQIVLAAGSVFPALANKPGLSQLGYASSTQWGISAAASTVTLNELQKFNALAAKVPIVRLDRPQEITDALSRGVHGRARWNHTTRAWLSSVGALVVITTLCLLITTLALRRYDPGVT
jgi:ABC-type transport system involved in multi-copper enzyme maturation permease subunit